MKVSMWWIVCCLVFTCGCGVEPPVDAHPTKVAKEWELHTPPASKSVKPNGVMAAATDSSPSLGYPSVVGKKPVRRTPPAPRPADSPSCGEGKAMCRGRCIDILSNQHNCGGCGNVCPQGACKQGVCQCRDAEKSACPISMSGNMTYSLCFDLQTNNEHCGGCGVKCSEGEICQKGACKAIVCSASESICARKCVNLQRNFYQCGQCGYRCANKNTASTHCSMGACKTVCSKGYSLCREERRELCVNLQNDAQNCGSCGLKCPMGGRVTRGACEQGVCVMKCIAGWSDCNGQCVHFEADNLNCGACGNSCSISQVCQKGVCVTE